MPRRSFSLVTALLVLTLGLVGSAEAIDLDGAKAGGQIGESADGYLGVVAGDAPAEVRQLVAEVNAGRREKYAEIAQQNGTSVETVAALAGRKLVDRAKAGEYVKTNGGWTRK
jgi:uncharacterized protein YdbL (DUF1318 family)